MMASFRYMVQKIGREEDSPQVITIIGKRDPEERNKKRGGGFYQPVVLMSKIHQLAPPFGKGSQGIIGLVQKPAH